MQTIKHRITYFLTSDQEDFDPARVNVDGNGASIPPIRAARDWEVIAPLDDDRVSRNGPSYARVMLIESSLRHCFI